MPTPRENETEREFVSRCIIDPEAMADFPDREQRIAFCYSQYERYSKEEQVTKSLEDDWAQGFAKELDKSEKAVFPSLRRFYEAEYGKGLMDYLRTGNVSFVGLFTASEFTKQYLNIYDKVGMRFANWYARYFDLYIPKGINPTQYQSVWKQQIEAYAYAWAAKNVTLVQGTAKQTLRRVIQALTLDPSFNALGNEQKEIILRRKFKQYSRYQAYRLVRTESTRAANFATRVSAETIFPPEQLMKKWITAQDERVRDTHVIAGTGEAIPHKDFFFVGGDKMLEPASGSIAKENVNCRCSCLRYPVEGAQTVGTLTGISGGVRSTTGFGF